MSSSQIHCRRPSPKRRQRTNIQRWLGVLTIMRKGKNHKLRNYWFSVIVFRLRFSIVWQTVRATGATARGKQSTELLVSRSACGWIVRWLVRRLVGRSVAVAIQWCCGGVAQPVSYCTLLPPVHQLRDIAHKQMTAWIDCQIQTWPGGLVGSNGWLVGWPFYGVYHDRDGFANVLQIYVHASCFGRLERFSHIVFQESLWVCWHIRYRVTIMFRQ